jgi:hypothetical protein
MSSFLDEIPEDLNRELSRYEHQRYFAVVMRELLDMTNFLEYVITSLFEARRSIIEEMVSEFSTSAKITVLIIPADRTQPFSDDAIPVPRWSVWSTWSTEIDSGPIKNINNLKKLCQEHTDLDLMRQLV